MKYKKAIWISYDFGLKGDYTGLFTWLDNQRAVECGSGLAFFRYEYEGLNSITDTRELIIKITSEIKEYVKLSKSDRVYLIWRDDVSKKTKGEFINGNRKQSPWEGYGKLKENNDIDSE